MDNVNTIKIESVLFLDIETAPNWLHFADVPENVRLEWIYKLKFKPDAPQYPEVCNHVWNAKGTHGTDQMIAQCIYCGKEGGENPNQANVVKMFEEKAERYYADYWKREASLSPEFSRIACITVGYMYQGEFMLTTYYDDNEGILLKKFFADLTAFQRAIPSAVLCAHYGKNFDFPFICKRALINRVPLHPMLDLSGKKPWEVPHIDTYELWKFGGTMSAGLPAICMAFGVPTPKNDLDGSKVAAAFHNGEIVRICVYCEADVFALLNVFKSMRLEEHLGEEMIVSRTTYN